MVIENLRFANRRCDWRSRNRA